MVTLDQGNKFRYLYRSNTIGSPAVCKNCVAVGAAYSTKQVIGVNDKYLYF